MNVIFYLDPESDSLKPNTLLQWAKWLNFINNALKNQSENYKSLFVGHNSSYAYFSHDLEFFFGLTSGEVGELINQSDKFRINGLSESDVIRLREILSFNFKPDFIIAIGDAKYLECVYPSAIIIHVEMAPFYKLLNSGLKFCITFSDCMKTSDISANIGQLDDYRLDLGTVKALNEIKSEVVFQCKSDELKLRFNDLRRDFKHICLIPLAESYFSPLRLKTFDLIKAFLEKSSSDQLYILADHPLVHAITDEEIFELKEKNSNILIVRNDFGDFKTSNFYELCDVVYTDFSNASLDSIFFDSIEYRSVFSENYIELSKYCNYRNSLTSCMGLLSREQKDVILFLLLTNYCLSGNIFFDGSWWFKMLSSCKKNPSLLDFQRILQKK